MELKDVQTFLTENKDKDDVKTFVAGLNPVTLDRVKEFVGKDKDATSWFDSEKDNHTKTALKTWQDNNLDKYYQDRYKKEHPDADPKDTALAEVKAQLEQMKADNAHKDLTAKALKMAADKKLPSELVNFFIGKDENETKKNLTSLEKTFTEKVNAAVEERLKGSYQPPKAEENPNLVYTMDQVKGMSPQEINEHWDDVQKTLEANK